MVVFRYVGGAVGRGGATVSNFVGEVMEKWELLSDLERDVEGLSRCLCNNSRAASTYGVK